jgi:lysozyme
VLKRWLAIPVILAALLPSANARADDAAFDGICRNGPAKGAQVESENYCNFFRHYDVAANKPIDTRVADALTIKNSSETRAIGLVIAISRYPLMDNKNLPAAAVDGQRLVDFLVNTQQFDEVIALTDENATFETIRYFLQTYLPARAEEFKGKARLLVAYSGHGRFGGEAFHTAQKPALILSNAKSVDASTGVYDMDQFYSDIKALAGTNAPESRARSAFHLITLVNACYGGEIFSQGVIGGNPDDFQKPGSYAITAGDDRNEVPSLNAARGSLFFDLLIEGITTGRADPNYWESFTSVDQSGKSDPHGMTRLYALADFLTGTYARIEQLRKNTPNEISLSKPWMGPAQQDVARGGFFFLSDHPATLPPNPAEIYRPNAAAAPVSSFGERAPRQASLTLPIGPVSALPGRPDIIVFKAPEVYPIRGYDISAVEGAIDWATFGEKARPRFLYARAAGWSGADPSFQDRAQGAKALGADFGAYAKFDFCAKPADQLERLNRVVQKEMLTLPIAIELVHPLNESNAQLACLNGEGLSAKKSEIVEFAKGVREAYGKIPLLFGNRYNLSQLTDERSDQFMLWMGNYGVQNIRLPGRNPWTLWQYSGKLNVPGIGPNTTGDVFFGTEDQYNEFKRGASNVAKTAASRGPE